MNYILTMSLDEIYNLEHVTVTEDDYNVYVTPNEGYYLIVQDYPEYQKYYDTLKMLKQEVYSEITVKPIYDPSTGLDSSIYENMAFNVSTGDDDYSWRTN